MVQHPRSRVRYLPRFLRRLQTRLEKSDFYHALLNLSWFWFFGMIGLAYLGTNILFACAYLLDEGGIGNARPGSFIDAFSFSVQTMATIGYGAMYPNSLYTHGLVTIEVLLGLLGMAMATSLMFARFSRPTARVLFSQIAVICPYDGQKTLMFRVANQRNNWIVEAQLLVSILLPNEITEEGHSMRRLADLKLVRSENPVLSLTWTVMHPIDGDSPLYGITPEEFTTWETQIIITLTGLDETVSQTIHARQIYRPENIIWNHRFVDVLMNEEDGSRGIDYSHFHDAVPMDPNPQLPSSTSPESSLEGMVFHHPGKGARHYSGKNGNGKDFWDC